MVLLRMGNSAVHLVITDQLLRTNLGEPRERDQRSREFAAVDKPDKQRIVVREDLH